MSAWKGDQHAHADRAVDDAEAAEAQDESDAGGHEKPRHGRQQLGLHPEALLRADGLGLIAGPSREQVGLVAHRLDRLDALQPAHCRAEHAGLIVEELLVQVDALRGEVLERQDVQGGDRNGEGGEDEVVLPHQRGVEDRHARADEGGGQLSGQQVGDAVVDCHARADVSGEPLREELHRQVHDVPQKPAGGRDRELGLQPEQVPALQPRENAGRGDRGAHGQEQRLRQLRRTPDEHVVDEQAQEGRRYQTGHDQQQTGADDVCQCRVRPRQPGAQRGRQASPDAPAPEVRPRLERESYAGERLIEFLRRHDPRPGRRVVQKDLPAPKALEHEEVVEVPVNDQRQRQVRQRRGLAPEPARDQPVAARALQHVAGLAAIAGHAARDAQFLQRHEAPEVGENHGERRGSALDRLHLQHRRYAHAPFLQQATGEAPHVPQRLHDYTPNCSRNSGTTISIGRRRSTVINAAHSVPVRMSIGGPADDDHL